MSSPQLREYPASSPDKRYGEVKRVEVEKPLSALGHSPPREEISQSHYITRVLASSRFDLFDEQGEKSSSTKCIFLLTLHFTFASLAVKPMHEAPPALGRD